MQNGAHQVLFANQSDGIINFGNINLKFGIIAEVFTYKRTRTRTILYECS